MERFSYKGGYGVHEHMHIKTLKGKLSWAIDKPLQLIINAMLFKTVILVRI